MPVFDKCNLDLRNCSLGQAVDFYNALDKDLSHFSNSNDICTPIECVKEMVDTIPMSFWEKKRHSGVG